MAYIIAEPCIGTKDNSCVEVCPVDCIHPTPDEPDYEAVEQLYIDPDECIDCDACVEACPVATSFRSATQRLGPDAQNSRQTRSSAGTIPATRTVVPGARRRMCAPSTVSYTHLTLPTIY